MPGQMIEFPSNGHSTPGYFARPGGGKGPGVLVIQEWWGLVDHIKDLVDRLAKQGFTALAPDLYHGEKAKSPDAAGKMLMALNIAQAGKDLRGAAQYLLGSGAVSSAKVGAVGFCMGGQLALFAACEHPDLVGAAVDFYGIHPNVKLNVDRLGGPVLCHFGRRDTSVSEADARALQKRIEASGKKAEVHFYDAGHAFFNDTRPEVYAPDAAKLAWERTLAFLRTSLK